MRLIPLLASTFALANALNDPIEVPSMDEPVDLEELDEMQLRGAIRRLSQVLPRPTIIRGGALPPAVDPGSVLNVVLPPDAVASPFRLTNILLKFLNSPTTPTVAAAPTVPTIPTAPIIPAP